MNTSSRTFLSVTAVLFAACALATGTWCSSMSAMGSMPMPGGWAMSMTWMLTPGQSWPGAAASFLGMWVTMMVAMMLPSLVPTLWRYRESFGRTSGIQPDLLTALVGVGYFAVWALFGIVAYLLGCLLAGAEMKLPTLARAIPLTVGIVVMAAGLLQLTSWKARQLARCRDVPLCACKTPTDARSALKCGLRLGVHCSYCCAGLSAALLVIDVMDLRAMALVTTAITLERVLPRGARAARVVGVAMVGAGIFLFVQAMISFSRWPV